MSLYSEITSHQLQIFVLDFSENLFIQHTPWLPYEQIVMRIFFRITVQADEAHSAFRTGSRRA